LNRLNTIAPVALLSCSVVQIAAAHDFWVQPSVYWMSPNTLATLTLQVGHGQFRQRSPIPARRIERFQAIGPAGAAIDLHDRLRLGLPAQDGDFQFQRPGAYVLVLQTDDEAQTHLPSIRFKDYLRAEGLTPALAQRARLNRMDADGSERYSRCAKSLLQIGAPAAGAQGQVTKATGLPLEIVPEANPYSVPRPSSLPVRAMYEGRALAGATVKLTDLSHDSTPFEVHVTDRSGRASFSMPGSGTWLLNVIWTKPLPRAAETDFETVFSSLSFGF
jgi:uncharacterized GH25 family protein